MSKDRKYKYVFFTRTFSVPPDGGTANSIYQMMFSNFEETGQKSVIICEAQNKAKLLQFETYDQFDVIEIPSSPFRPRELYLDYFVNFLREIEDTFSILDGADLIISRHLYFSYALCKMMKKHVYVLASFYAIETHEFLSRSYTSLAKSLYLRFQARLQGRIERLVLLSEFPSVVVLSEMRKNELYSLYGVRSNVVRPGVHRTNIKKPKKGLAHRLLIHCRHEARKNLTNFLLEILEHTSIYENLKIDVIGHGPETRALHAIVEKEAFLRDRVTFHGFVDDIDMFYQGCDLLIFPTLHEGFGQVVQESMIREVPVICYGDVQTPFSEFIRHGETGFLEQNAIKGSISKRVHAIYSSPEILEKVRKNLRIETFPTWVEFFEKLKSGAIQ